GRRAAGGAWRTRIALVRAGVGAHSAGTATRRPARRPAAATARTSGPDHRGPLSPTAETGNARRPGRATAARPGRGPRGGGRVATLGQGRAATVDGPAAAAHPARPAALA